MHAEPEGPRFAPPGRIQKFVQTMSPIYPSEGLIVH